jgi:hypothetical protein
MKFCNFFGKKKDHGHVFFFFFCGDIHSDRSDTRRNGWWKLNTPIPYSPTHASSEVLVAWHYLNMTKPAELLTFDVVYDSTGTTESLRWYSFDT